ncbi:hypothetical protein GE061_020079 [Apolygus lucorum]|uniref:Uncharacterized protein n=1 Tax=Apolygus lucorum TaxID=248454 RepID=A0A6A4JIL4_APOLU|nr:hypothetical protein GE061_020079 [Apolygus lucorum]
MDPIPRIRVRKEIFGQVVRSTDDTPSSPKQDSVSEWKKSLLIRDLDLVQASIKIIVAMPAESQHITKLGKLIRVSLNDVEGVLLYNHIPIRKLDLTSPSNLPWSRERDAEQNDDNADNVRPWRRAMIARNMDLIHTTVHALLMNLPQMHKRQLADTALATLKDLHNIILNDESSPQQIITFTGPFKADESEYDGSSRMSFDSLSQTQSLDGWEFQSESQDGMETENMASLDRPHENPLFPEEPRVSRISHNPPRTLQTQTVEPKKLNVMLPLRDESRFPDNGNKKPRWKFCNICKNSLFDGSCVSCKHFALKMETSMKQNVFYECSHANNAGGSNCKVCRFNLILKFMPNYASQKVEVIHRQIGPRPTSQNENSQEPFEDDTRSRVSSPNFPSTSAFQSPLSFGAGRDLRPKPTPSPLIEQPTSDEPSIVISAISSLAKPANPVCPVCAFEVPEGNCRPCRTFAQRMEELMKKDIFYECAHENNSGSPKCRVCRYNRIALLRADQGGIKEIVPWSKY